MDRMDTAGDDVEQQDDRGGVRVRRTVPGPGQREGHRARGHGPGQRARAHRPGRRPSAPRVTRLLVAAIGLVLLPLGALPAVAATATVSGTGARSAPAAEQPRTSSARGQAAPGTSTNPDPGTDPGADPDQSPSPLPSRAPTTPPGTGAPTIPTAPTITDPGDITTDLARFSGRATPGHSVRVVDPAVPSASVCRTTTRPDGTWSCVGTVHSGPAQVFSVLDTSSSSLPSVDAAPSDVIVPPVIDTRQPTTGAVTGTGRAGATVTVARAGTTAVLTATVGPSGTWHVSWGVGPGAPADGPVTVTATQTASTADGYRSDLRSAVSAARTVTIDRTAPAAPRITTPAGAARITAQPVRVAGTAEAGTIVTAYVDDVAVCRSEVSTDGSWSCRVGDTLRAGVHRIAAGAQDDAGNTSRTSAAVTVQIAGAPTPSDSGTPGSPTGPTAGDGPASGSTPNGGSGNGADHGQGDDADHVPGSHGSSTSGGPDGTPSGGAGDGRPGGTTPDDDPTAAGALPAPGGGSGGHPDWSGPAGDWSVATGYDHAVPTIQSTVSWRTLAIAAGVAAAFLLLVAGPVRVLAGAVRRRLPERASRFTGRNRPRSERTHGDDTLPTWATVGVAVTLAGLLALLGTGIALEARYVRLAIGVLAGAAVLTASVVLATRWAAGADRHTVTYRVSPWLVLAAVVACGLTRTLDLSPALVVGVLLVPVGRTDVDTAAVRVGAGLAACARGATWRSVALLGVAAVGWVLHSVTPSSGFTGSLVSEFASTLCVGGLGSLVVTLLPLRGSAGAALASVSRPRYAGLAAVAVGLAAAVYSGPTGTHVPAAAMTAGVAAVVASAVCVWAWSRFRGPVLPS
jgi:hypothetical protein